MHNLSLFYLIRKEIQIFKRDRTFIVLAALVWLFLIASTILSAYQYQREVARQKVSTTLFRKQWEAQKNDLHEAAHFGTYLFKPLNLLNAFDPGLDDYSGNTYRIEAHVLHEVEMSAAENSSAGQRLGSFSLSLILQLFIPLLIFFMTAPTVAMEKELGTLKMQVAQGLPMTIVYRGKVFAVFLLIMIVILPLFAGLGIALLFSTVSALLWPRLVLIMLTYVLYYLLITIVGVLVSSLSDSSKTATTAGLILWLSYSILIPKIATQIADQCYKLPPRNAFNDNIRQGYLKGINGQDPYYNRGEKYLKKLMKAYGVDSIAKLPVDGDAMVMQYHEDYQVMVFNHYYRQIDNSFQQQQVFLGYAGFADPFISLKRISMTMAGSDFQHHADFFLQARTYRNNLIRRLNLTAALTGPANRKAFRPQQGYYKRFGDFQYQLLALPVLWKLQWKAYTSLLFWIIFLFLLLHLTSKRSII